MRDHSTKRLEAEEKRLIKNRLKALERKNLITFSRKEGYRQATLTPAAQKQLANTEIIRRVQAEQPSKWDGKWRMVSFDIPTEHSSYRIALRQLLLECNFLQIQQSVYVCPYFYRELYDYLANNRALGGHVHFFEGKYIGDDTALRKEFNLDK
jgi:DNA-binding transcriptional regulator PaaX